MYWKFDGCPDCGCEAGEPCANEARMHPAFDTTNPVCPGCGSDVEVYETVESYNRSLGEWKHGFYLVSDHDTVWTTMRMVKVICTGYVRTGCGWQSTLPDNVITYV